ncbi:hypothetical protein D3C75_872570 [compost metagenome]
MTREEQKEIRELEKQIPIEIRKLKKEFRFQFSYGFLYRFEGDFLYIAIISLPSNRVGIINIVTLINPWILNELYWEIQQMNMEEMRSQPKSFHVNGAFTINDIFYQSDSIPYTKDKFDSAVQDALVFFNAAIEEHKKKLVHIQALAGHLEGYKVSNLTKAIVHMYNHDYKSALQLLLQEETVKDTYEHVHLAGTNAKSAREYAVELCEAKLK